MTTKVKGYASKSGAKRAFVKAGGSIEGATYAQTEDGKWYMVGAEDAAAAESNQPEEDNTPKQVGDAQPDEAGAAQEDAKPAKRKRKPAAGSVSEEKGVPAKKSRKKAGKVATAATQAESDVVPLIVDWDKNLRTQIDEQVEAFEKALLANQPVPDVFVLETEAGLEVVAGFHRAQAYLNLTGGGDTVHLGYKVLSADLTEAQRIGIALRENEGKPLTGIQRAKAYAMLREQGLDVNATAKEVGRSRADVEKYLMLASATQPVLDLVEDGTIAVLKAVEYVRKYGDDAHKYITKDLAKAVAKGKKKSSVAPTPQFPIKQSRDFVKLVGDRIRIDDEETTDERVVFWGELTADEWNQLEQIIEEWKTFVADHDPE